VHTSVVSSASAFTKSGKHLVLHNVFPTSDELLPQGSIIIQATVDRQRERLSRRRLLLVSPCLPPSHLLPLWPTRQSSALLTPPDSNSDKVEPDKPISAGFYRLEKGTPLVYTYTYHEMKIIVEGEFDIEDETGQKVHAVPGDVFWFPKGAKITFTTNSYGLAFYTGSRVEGGA